MTVINDTKSAAELSDLLGGPVEILERLSGGRNSQVFSIALNNGQKYAAKRYFRDESDKRDRQEVEFRSLQFLWDQGVRSVPEPIGTSVELGWSVYEFAGDTKIASGQVTEEDIDFSSDFLLELSKLKSDPKSDQLPAASEACFSMQAIVENLNSRVAALSETTLEAQKYPAFASFMTSEVRPTITRILDWCQKRSSDHTISFAGDIERQRRTLSPSDFGFHNAVRRDDRSIVFLDFEYFGWDDPAKMTSDYLLHPAMDLKPQLLRRFVGHIIEGFSDNPQLADRVRLTYPLFGLKWCLILLNEFLPANMARREFAAGRPQEAEELRAGQLAKAKTMLDRVNREYESFPYLD